MPLQQFIKWLIQNGFNLNEEVLAPANFRVQARNSLLEKKKTMFDPFGTP